MTISQSGGSHQSGGSGRGSGDFADDPQRVSKAAKKRGRRRRSPQGSLGSQAESEKSRLGDSVSEAARKGGEHPHNDPSK